AQIACGKRLGGREMRRVERIRRTGAVSGQGWRHDPRRRVAGVPSPCTNQRRAIESEIDRSLEIRIVREQRVLVVEQQTEHDRPRPVVLGLLFNDQNPLFANNPDLERAINFALDRPALIRTRGRYAGHPTARIMPPTLPGYGTRSPYPLDAPHLTTAQTLAAGNLR